jgi:hypothetical protein
LLHHPDRSVRPRLIDAVDIHDRPFVGIDQRPQQLGAWLVAGQVVQLHAAAFISACASNPKVARAASASGIVVATQYGPSGRKPGEV